MKKEESFKFFVWFLLVTVLTILLVTAALFFTSAGGIGIYIGALIVIINVIVLMSFMIMAFYKMIKHIFDKEKTHFEFMYIVNLLFTVLINAVFLTFYFSIMAGTMLALLPFLV